MTKLRSIISGWLHRLHVPLILSWWRSTSGQRTGTALFANKRRQFATQMLKTFSRRHLRRISLCATLSGSRHGFRAQISDDKKVCNSGASNLGQSANRRAAINRRAWSLINKPAGSQIKTRANQTYSIQIIKSECWCDYEDCLQSIWKVIWRKTPLS